MTSIGGPLQMPSSPQEAKGAQNSIPAVPSLPPSILGAQSPAGSAVEPSSKNPAHPPTIPQEPAAARAAVNAQKNVAKQLTGQVTVVGKKKDGACGGQEISVSGKKGDEKKYLQKVFYAYNFTEIQYPEELGMLHETLCSQVYALIAGSDVTPKTYLQIDDKGEHQHLLSRMVANSQSLDKVESFSPEHEQNIAITGMRAIVASWILGDTDIKGANMVTDFKKCYRVDFAYGMQWKRDLKEVLIENGHLSPIHIVHNLRDLDSLESVVAKYTDECSKEIVRVLNGFANLDPKVLVGVLNKFSPFVQDTTYLPQVEGWLQTRQVEVIAFLNELQPDPTGHGYVIL